MGCHLWCEGCDTDGYLSWGYLVFICTGNRCSYCTNGTVKSTVSTSSGKSRAQGAANVILGWPVIVHASSCVYMNIISQACGISHSCLELCCRRISLSRTACMILTMTWVRPYRWKFTHCSSHCGLDLISRECACLDVVMYPHDAYELREFILTCVECQKYCCLACAGVASIREHVTLYQKSLINEK